MTLVKCILLHIDNHQHVSVVLATVRLSRMAACKQNAFDQSAIVGLLYIII